MGDNNYKKTDSREVNAEAVVTFLGNTLQKASDFARHMDNQTNILVVLSSGIFILSTSQMRNNDGSVSLPLLVLAIFSLLSALMALFAILPPWFMRKKGQKQSLLYNKFIAEFESPSVYSQELLKLSQNIDLIIEQYALELYNIGRYYHRPKRQLFKIARHLLVIGIFASLIMMIIEIIQG